MLLLRVHAAVRQQTEQVQPPPSRACRPIASSSTGFYTNSPFSIIRSIV